jgi:hypothetical protein
VDGEPETFTKPYGQRNCLAGTQITCEATIVEVGGTFVAHVAAVAVPSGESPSRPLSTTGHPASPAEQVISWACSSPWVSEV